MTHTKALSGSNSLDDLKSLTDLRFGMADLCHSTARDGVSFQKAGYATFSIEPPRDGCSFSFGIDKIESNNEPTRNLRSRFADIQTRGTNRKRHCAAWQKRAKPSCQFLHGSAPRCHFRLPAGHIIDKEFQRVAMVGVRGFEPPALPPEGRGRPKLRVSLIELGY